MAGLEREMERSIPMPLCRLTGIVPLSPSRAGWTFELLDDVHPAIGGASHGSPLVLGASYLYFIVKKL